MSPLIAAAGFGIFEGCAYGFGGQGVGSVVGNSGVSSCLLASRSLRLCATIPKASSISSSSSFGQSAIRHRRFFAGSSASFRSITPSGLSSEEVSYEVWPLFFIGATIGFLPVSRLACSDSSSIASQSTLEGSSSMGGGCASWARGMTSGHSMPGGQDTNVLRSLLSIKLGNREQHEYQKDSTSK
jgi:hypothetical protein